jgi:hypothetical protein
MDARLALHAMPLKKSGWNDFSKYDYFELGDFLPETLKLFHASNLCGVVTFEIEMAKLTLTDLDDGTELVITSPMAEAALKGAHAIQNLGAVQTYMRRYLWVTAMEVVENDYLDKVHNKNAAAPAPKPPKPADPPAPRSVAPRPPPTITGQEGAWQLKVTLEHGGDIQNWLGVIDDACKLALEMAQSEADVMAIFKKNKQLFDEVKKQDANFFKGLMAKFTEAKAKVNQPAQE